MFKKLRKRKLSIYSNVWSWWSHTHGLFNDQQECCDFQEESDLICHTSWTISKWFQSGRIDDQKYHWCFRGHSLLSVSSLITRWDEEWVSNYIRFSTHNIEVEIGENLTKWPEFDSSW